MDIGPITVGEPDDVTDAVKDMKRSKITENAKINANVFIAVVLNTTQRMQTALNKTDS